MKIPEKTLVLLLTSFLAGCCAIPSAITQFSTIDYLLAGGYDGLFTMEEVARRGDLGIGTIDHIDGEMILLDGKMFVAHGDGRVREFTPKDSLPFASVVDFTPGRADSIGPCESMEELTAELDRLQPGPNSMVAFRMHGSFKEMTTRSFPRQEKPYLPLIEIVNSQNFFRMQNVKGWLLGFRMPPYVKGMNVPGWHLHFLSDDCTKGGHVVGFKLQEGLAETAVISDFHLVLSADSEEFQKANLSLDRSAEIKKVESDTK